jgi:hypothetical protein
MIVYGWPSVRSEGIAEHRHCAASYFTSQPKWQGDLPELA